MAKVITFSREFPRHHPRAGEPTFFVEKILESRYPGNIQNIEKFGTSPIPKYHTIRAGKRFKVGDLFSPRYWSGKPYRSKQVEIEHLMVVLRVWDFTRKGDSFFLNGKSLTKQPKQQLRVIAQNDGLCFFDFINWFPSDFDGQIICWSNEVDYDQFAATHSHSKMNELLEGCKSDLNQMLDIIEKHISSR